MRLSGAVSRVPGSGCAQTRMPVCDVRGQAGKHRSSRDHRGRRRSGGRKHGVEAMLGGAWAEACGSIYLARQRSAAALDEGEELVSWEDSDISCLERTSSCQAWATEQSKLSPVIRAGWGPVGTDQGFPGSSRQQPSTCPALP